MAQHIRVGRQHAPRRDGLVGNAALVAVVLLVGLPLAAISLRAVLPDGEWGLSAVTRMAESPRTWRLLGLTVAQAVASCVITLAIGVPVAWTLATFRFPGRAALLVAVTLPFVLPAVVVGSAIAALVGPSGLVDIRGTWIAVLGAHLCFNLAVVVRTMKVAISSVPVELDQSARLLGVGRFGVARRVVLPAVTPALLASAVVVFMYCLTSFGVLLVLGGGRVSTLEVEIWSRATRQFDISGAAVLAVLQFIAVVAALAVHGRVARSARGSRTSGRDRDRRPSGNLEWAAVAAAIAAIGAVSVLPLTALAMRSVQIGPTWTLEN